MITCRFFLKKHNQFRRHYQFKRGKMSLMKFKGSKKIIWSTEGSREHYNENNQVNMINDI